MNKFLFILIWLLSLIIVSIYTYENPEKIEIIKNYFKKDKDAKVKLDKTLIQKVESENKLDEVQVESQINSSLKSSEQNVGEIKKETVQKVEEKKDQKLNKKKEKFDKEKK